MDGTDGRNEIGSRCEGGGAYDVEVPLTSFPREVTLFAAEEGGFEG